MLVYGAEVVAVGQGGERTISIDEFFTGPFQTVLKQSELLTEIRTPAPESRSGGAYVKLERKVGDFATAAVAAQITLDKSGKVSRVGIALTNVGPTPIKVTAAEQALIENKPEDSLIRQAAALASAAAKPEGDARAVRPNTSGL